MLYQRLFSNYKEQIIGLECALQQNKELLKCRSVQVAFGTAEAECSTWEDNTFVCKDKLFINWEYHVPEN